jgi:hypothetical protein
MDQPLRNKLWSVFYDYVYRHWLDVDDLTDAPTALAVYTRGVNLLNRTNFIAFTMPPKAD